MLAYATKDQLSVFKLAVKDREEGRGAFVQLDIDYTPGVAAKASLSATDGKKAIRRDIMPAEGVEDYHANISRHAIQAAQKLMGKDCRAYFHTNKIRVARVGEDPKTYLETLETIADIPFTVQTELEFDVRNVLEHSVEDSEVAERRVCVPLKDLQAALNQFKHGNNAIWVHVTMRGNNEVLKISAFEQLDGEGIFAAVAPIQED